MSVTTFIDTIASVVLASSIGPILSDYFGPLGWVYSAVLGALAVATPAIAPVPSTSST